jgi:hypothetical protein
MLDQQSAWHHGPGKLTVVPILLEVSWSAKPVWRQWKGGKYLPLSGIKARYIEDATYSLVGRTIAQAVSRWLPTAAAQVRTRVCSSGICGGQSGAGFSEYFGFPLPIFIPPNSPSSQSPGAGTIRQKWTTCRVDPVWTPTPTMQIKKKNIYIA